MRPQPPLAERGTAEADALSLGLQDQIESLCVECHEQGMTRILLTYIPYFNEVIVVSFRCEHCGTPLSGSVKSFPVFKAHSACDLRLPQQRHSVGGRDPAARVALHGQDHGPARPEPAAGQVEPVHHLDPRVLAAAPGFARAVHEELDATGFAKGDAAQAGQADGMAVLLKNLKLVSGFEGREGPEADAEPRRTVMSAEIPFTVILDDTMANSYIHNL